MKARMQGLERRREALEAELATATEPKPRLHPGLAEVYRQKVAALHEAPDRAALRQAEGAAAQGCRPDQGGPLVHHRQADRHRPSQRVRQLSPQLRLWFYLKRKYSRSRASRVCIKRLWSPQLGGKAVLRAWDTITAGIGQKRQILNRIDLAARQDAHIIRAAVTVSVEDIGAGGEFEHQERYGIQNTLAPHREHNQVVRALRASGGWSKPLMVRPTNTV